MLRQFGREVGSQIDKVPKLSQIAETTAVAVHGLFCQDPPNMNGMSLLSPVRRGFGGYYYWTDVSAQQDLCFAGRSVLHRIDKDIKKKHSGSIGAEDVLLSKL